MVSAFQTELHEADAKLNAYVNQTAATFAAEGKGPQGFEQAMSLAIAVTAQTFLRCGGNIDMGEVVGEMVKQGIITTLQAYKDQARATHKPTGGVN